MENIKYLYNILLTEKIFYFSYLRTFLLFFSEKNILAYFYKFKLEEVHKNTKSIYDLIDKYNYTENLNFKKKSKKIFIINGCVLHHSNCLKNIKLKKYITKKKIKFFFTYKIFNNLNLSYIINFLLCEEEINILIKNTKVKNKEIYILNFFDIKNNEQLTPCKKNITLLKNSNIKLIDVYLSRSKNSILNIENFINIKESGNLNYTVLFNASNENANIISFYINQEKASSLHFSDFLKDVNNFELNYYFFLNCDNSSLTKRTFKKANKEYFDKRVCNIYHYNTNTVSSTFFGALVDNKSKIIFDGNIIVGFDVKHVKAQLKCEGLLLSNTSYIEFNPNMFINNNEVSCAHGASIGHIDINIINYMRARGLTKEICKKIIKHAFIKTYVNQKKINNIYNKINSINYE
jgi:Fe-S cluster assembly protein SufD